MNITITPGMLSGKIRAIPSKSQAHRLLICAAFSNKGTHILCSKTNQDIEATVGCLTALGARIQRTIDGYFVRPVTELPKSAILDCRESGSTLRFMLPVCCALGVETTFLLCGRLPNRPLSPLWEELERMGCSLSRPTANTVHVRGKMKPGTFQIAGNVSSQFISGLLFATALMHGYSNIQIIGNIESLPYITMTQNALSLFGVKTDHYKISGGYPFCSPGRIEVEGDWSNGSFFLIANALGNQLTIENLNDSSAQGDRMISFILSSSDADPVVNAADIPDLVPILAVFFASRSGAVFTNVQRLRTKESDRIETVCSMLRAFGIDANADGDTLTVGYGRFQGCIIDAANDHRIAMSAAIAATIADGPVTILGAECVAKSYPSFWDEYRRLGGHYEQYIR